MKDTGGPAFPVDRVAVWGENGTISELISDLGISKRDWFAGMAMQSLMHTQYVDMTYEGEPAAMAFEAYRLADAMLAERSKT